MTGEEDMGMILVDDVSEINWSSYEEWSEKARADMEEKFPEMWKRKPEIFVGTKIQKEDDGRYDFRGTLQI